MVSNSKPVIEGTVIMAEEQTAGRGQQQNGWYAEPGKNLTFSLLLKPTFLPITDQFHLTKATSLGVYDALKPLLGDALKIKWPNDIYYGNKKLGGMLIENMIQGGQIKNAVVGIGLNINQQNFPEHLPNATSVMQILGVEHDLKLILASICRHIEAYYLTLKADKVNLLKEKYLSHLFRFNEVHVFRSKGEEFEGVIKDVRDNGILVVVKHSAEHEFSLKEIEFVL